MTVLADLAALVVGYDDSPSPDHLRVLADALDEFGLDSDRCRILADWQEKAARLAIPTFVEGDINEAFKRLDADNRLLWACLCLRCCPHGEIGRVSDLLKDPRSRLGLSGAELSWCGLIGKKDMRARMNAAYTAASPVFHDIVAAAAAYVAATACDPYAAYNAVCASANASSERTESWCVGLANKLHGPT
jgi:hypothetical protein